MVFPLYLFIEYFHYKELPLIYYGVTLSYIFVRQAKYTLDSFPLLTSFFFFNDLLHIILQRRSLRFFTLLSIFVNSWTKHI